MERREVGRRRCASGELIPSRGIPTRSSSESMDLHLYMPGRSGSGRDSGAEHPDREIYEPERGARLKFPRLEVYDFLHDLAEF